jgi:signal transduction histidine kinase
MPLLLAALLLAPCSGTAATAEIDSLRAVLVDMPADTSRAMALHNLSRALFLAHSDSALEPAVEGERIARRHNFWRGIMMNLYAQGLAHYSMGRYTEALVHYTQSLELAEGLRANAVRFRLLNNIGVVQNITGRQAEALAAYHQCLELAPQVGATRHLPLILMNIGNIYAYVDDHETALEYFQRGVEQLDDEASSTAASLWSNSAIMSQQLGRPADAVAQARRSLEIRRVLGDPLLVAKGQAVLASSMLVSGRPDTALVLAEAALAVAEGVSDPISRADIRLTTAEACFELGRFEEARRLALQSVPEAAELGDQRMRRRGVGLLNKIESELGNDRAAASYAALFVALNDSLTDASRVREIAALQRDYENRMQIAIMEQRHRADVRLGAISAAAIILIAVIVARLYQVQRSLNRSLNERNDTLEYLVSERTSDLRSLSQHIVRLREEERRRIARDIHDDLSQALTAIRLNVSHVQMQNGNSDLDPVLVRTADIAAGALKESSRLIRDLRPIALEELGLCGALAWLADRHRARTGADVDVDVPESVVCGEDVTLAMFRIAQEALQNVAKHARASFVEVGLEQALGNVTLTIRDDGVGLGEVTGHPGSFGLLGMKEGALSVGGRLDVLSGPGEGTEIRVTVPC